MNLRSEIDFFTELRLLDKARLLTLFLHELAEEARGTYGAGAAGVASGGPTRGFDKRLQGSATPISARS